MSWTPDRDIIFCLEILFSNLFLTRKSSTERGKVWETIADRLSDIRHPTFRVDQRSVRDHYNKLLSRFKRKMREEIGASGISPEKNEIDVLLEEIVERDEAAASEKENIDEEKRKVEADKVAADDIRRKAMEKLSETKKRKAREGDQNVKKKRRSNGNEAVSYLLEKAEMEIEVKKKEMDLKRAEHDLEKSRQEKQVEQQTSLHEQENNLIKIMMEQHQQQQQQMQAIQVMMLQQQNQAMVALLEKLSK